MGKDFQTYNVKTIETPTTLEIWEYLDEAVIYAVEKGKKEKSDIIIENNKKEIITANKEYDAIKRKQKHYENMRWVIARIVDCNFDTKTKFITLTFKDNIQDLEYTNYEFNKFIKRLNFQIYHEKKQKLKYLAVWEKQKRGAIHYHIIFFDFPYLKMKELQEIWGHGFIKINKIDVDSKDNRGRYVSKYFSKDIDDKNYKQKAFFRSRNLIMPVTTTSTQREPLDLSNENIVYTKEYSRKVPNYYNPLKSNNKDGVSFVDGTVRYTRIRKDNNNDNNYDNKK